MAKSLAYDCCQQKGNFIASSALYMATVGSRNRPGCEYKSCHSFVEHTLRFRTQLPVTRIKLLRECDWTVTRTVLIRAGVCSGNSHDVERKHLPHFSHADSTRSMQNPFALLTSHPLCPSRVNAHEQAATCQEKGEGAPIRIQASDFALSFPKAIERNPQSRSHASF